MAGMAPIKGGRYLARQVGAWFVRPHKMVNGKREAVGAKAKVYPAAVDADDWLRAQEMLNARGLTLRGRKGDIANLFTGKIHCAVCGGSMRVDRGGGPDEAPYS